MRWILSLFLLLFVNTSLLCAQDSLKSAVTLQVGMNNLDFQTGIGYAYSWDRFQALSSIELGINRSVFQGRIFPRLTIGGAYKLVTKKKFYFGPMITFSHSILKVNKLSTHLTSWNELYAGARMELGTKWRFIYSMAAGWQNERYFNTYLDRTSGVNSVGFNVNLGLAYAW